MEFKRDFLRTQANYLRYLLNFVLSKSKWFTAGALKTNGFSLNLIKVTKHLSSTGTPSTITEDVPILIRISKEINLQNENLEENSLRVAIGSNYSKEGKSICLSHSNWFKSERYLVRSVKERARITYHTSFLWFFV